MAFEITVLVINNIHGDTLIYGSAIGVQPGVVPSKQTFCPYAFHQRDQRQVQAFDLSQGYDYQNNITEWYHEPRAADYSNVTVLEDVIVNKSGSNLSSQEAIRQPSATYEDGHWTFPYFDCGGGDIWMTTYSSPILALDSSGDITFQGVATIDIELTNLDINQCEIDDTETAQALDVFRGTHNCQPTTQCKSLSQGFRAGSYLCECQDGYYFPNTSATLRAFSGADIEAYFEATNSTSGASQFQCLQCPRGCDTCEDATPCLYQISEAVQALVMFVISIMIIACLIVSVVTFCNRKNLVYVMYGEVDTLACKIQIWPFHLGMVLMYGALLIKTWRISVIFKAGGTTKRVHLPDKALLQRMIPLVVVTVAYLVCWEILDPPKAVTVKTSAELKFFVCEMHWWLYGAFGAEALMLLFGVYLCFTVRKAPAHFNESKFITWATYNAIILGSFILMLTQFVGMSGGPDIVFALLMAQQQVFVTIPMCLIFAPKFWALHKGSTNNDGGTYSNHAVTITGRVKPSLAPSSSRFSESVAVVMTKCSAVQCNPEDFFLTSGTQFESGTMGNTLAVPSTNGPPPSPLSLPSSLAKISSKVSPFHYPDSLPVPESNGFSRQSSSTDA
ncbi:G-protein coupled receptor [Plakobranchus ocellatus]|uniref:G-protein coupled receptor n=1 Tax=Plakobranchus ocellatus TaxID=259542 RepID=A0AAV3ZI81_9GAST|nr:G-protein coupled receptor [Plakobranchus ocellatus]